MNRFVSLSSLLGVSLLPIATLLCVACSSAEGASSAGADAAASQDAATKDAQTEASAPDPACEAFSSTVQAGLEAERAKQKLKYATVAVWSERCGTSVYLSHDPARPAITEDAYWRIGSVTKTYVATTTLRLVEHGKLSLEDTLDKWFPDFPRGNAITVRHLLNHTSGIYNYTETQKFIDTENYSPTKTVTPEEIIGWANEQSPTNEPGASFNYSNTNYILLGRIIEIVTGEKVAVVLRREVFEPAGLTHTFLDGAETVPGDFARGFLNGRDVTQMFNMSVPWTAGAMAVTPADLVRWLRALYIDQKILAPSSFGAMTTSVAGAGYGLGCEIFPAKATGGMGAGLGHGGSIFGFQTQASAFPDAKAVIVAIAGDTGGDPNGLSLATFGAFKTLRETQ